MRARLPVAVLLITALVVACGGSAGETDSPGPTATPVAEPTATADAATPAAVSPEPADTPAPSAPASPIPTAVGSEPPASAGPGVADACTGTDANRDFFESVAAAVAWPVYCPVLPGGWFVDAGEYRLAAGGRMEITYRGPGGARLELREGAFCATDDGCVPAGTELGDAPFGDLTGTLVSADDGRWAISVDAGAPISWLAVGSGLEEATFRAYVAALTPVSG
jgi:hypothetical protein